MKAIHLQIDNKTTFSYLVKMGGNKNQYLIKYQKTLASISYIRGSQLLQICSQEAQRAIQNAYLFRKYFREFVRSDKDQNWIFLLSDYQLNLCG